MRKPNQTTGLLEGAIRKHVPIAAWHGGAETLMPDYQDVMKTLPPNPPLSEILQRAAREEREDQTAPER